MKKSKMSGIQKKYLKYMCTLLILALVRESKNVVANRKAPKYAGFGA